MIQPSCPVLVIHADDAFRKSLIASLDREHFVVTSTDDSDRALELLAARPFNVVIVGLNLTTGLGKRSLAYLEADPERAKCGVLVLGDSDPAVKTYAPWVDETLLKPVDPAYVATRARTYCKCG
jgi:DNA-binding response OmpR family regulator